MVSNISSVLMKIRLSSFDIVGSTYSLFVPGTCISTVIVMKMCVDVRSAIRIFSVFECAALLAADPAWADVASVCDCESAKVSGIVTSVCFPLNHGMM